MVCNIIGIEIQMFKNFEEFMGEIQCASSKNVESKSSVWVFFSKPESGVQALMPSIDQAGHALGSGQSVEGKIRLEKMRKGSMRLPQKFLSYVWFFGRHTCKGEFLTIDKK